MDLYGEASRILGLIDNKRGSAKNFVFSSRYKNGRQLYALVIETIKHDKALKEILDATQIQKKETSLKEKNLAKCVLYDFLFGKGIFRNKTIQSTLKQHESELRAALENFKAKQDEIATNEDSVYTSVVLPRYVRVNTLKTTLQKVVDQFVKEGYQCLDLQGHEYDSYLNALRDLQEKEFAVDKHVPELLVFSSATDFHEHPLYKSGHVILQDKASCLPAVALNPPKGSHVIDCCAAPGNKTTLMAALMNNEGKIFAFDRDRQRFATLKSLSEKAGASCLIACNKDFLRVNPGDPCYSKVEYILVDPSCSGSGIVGRNLSPDEKSISASRLQSLASFQAMILRHALSFPNVKHVVYSTCSIHKEENELVVLDVLTKLEGLCNLRHVLPSLPCRGDPEVFPDAVKCVSMNPEKSLTNGFFIALFERTGSKLLENSQPLNSVPQTNGKNKRKMPLPTNGEVDKELHKVKRRKKIVKLSNDGIEKDKEDGSICAASDATAEKFVVTDKIGLNEKKINQNLPKNVQNADIGQQKNKKKQKKRNRQHKPVTRS